ncbi:MULTISPECIES: pyridoxal phosphate-dependent aminotransferase [Methanosarcina]|uniref:Aminotransferase n=1 Tax=Methanosarcina vacuolata Z-761 TaxID=1434123 RepID=A0A0E3LGZ3_9EURY|nr:MULTISPECIES: pyridoxal phosphate-dependent aminotransferase [Methanosarcina]AKB43371.1 Aspartate aminotransferase [Methanosarcina vacuolata Z-761]AKB46834.1 Aspartate aminotransferase [Methanosarcina sp. Kolksee]
MSSARLKRVEESATIRISNIATRMIKEGTDVINFSLGEPDFNTPKNICDAAAKAMYEGKTHYAPSGGIPELRAAIAEKLRTENNLDVTEAGVLVTPGAKQGIFEVMMGVLDDGDQALLFNPSWVTYDACIRFAGAETVWVPTVPEKGFIPDNFEEYITDKTKLIVVNSPGNPTGGVFGKKTLHCIADLAIDHDLIVVSDEIYEKIIYDREHISIGSLDGMQERTITVNGFSKAYAMTGWRLGYLTAPPEILKLLLKIQSHSVSSATTFVQYGGLEALQGPQDSVKAMVDRFKVRRDVLIDGLNKMGFECKKPDGAFYAFANVSEYGNGTQVAERLLKEAQVAVTPGIAFGSSGEDFVRISYATSIDRIREALERLEKVFS